MFTAIEITDLHQHFGRKKVLDGLSLSVPAGSTFAFLGPNGAGKTTTIRCLLGLQKPDSGTVRVLGMDPHQQPVEVRRAVGYLAEDQTMFPWMTIPQILKFMAPFYPTWNHDLADRLVKQFNLPLDTKIQNLSKGQNVRLGLLLALAHEPKLVILDDPTLGLDPIMRKQLLRDVVGYLQGRGITVFFSSHLLYEIEPVADQVAILHEGRIIRQSPTDELRDRVKRLILPESSNGLVNTLPALLDVQRSMHQVSAIVEDIRAAEPAVAQAGLRPQITDLNLDEIFEAYVIGNRGRIGPQMDADDRRWKNKNFS